ncbi:hypothetical protein EQG49_12195 [Periweissella cryptocerci]|uniref:Integrase n=1 Tax=Periweissella cryptocerci TaxID=2506420 RepID=A0A4P6YWF2_9LACO|nr:hypothetical protein [Periweissella cryptocerci]QBO37158.1 hypothetical protein EQG49_12195 [Periweissella cryptocerci]
MTKVDLEALSHLIQDGDLSFELRLALVLLNHGMQLDDLATLTEIPSLPWVPFEKPFIKAFKKYQSAAPFNNVTAPELLKALQPYR